jgi:hypothetical protein
VENQFMLGLSFGCILVGGLCALCAIIFRSLQKNDEQKAIKSIVQPVLSLRRSIDGVWYMEAITRDGVFTHFVEPEDIENIIADFVAMEFSPYREFYEFDIHCSNGEELSVTMQKKTKMGYN